MNADELSPAHNRALRAGSAIETAVISARSYRTVTSKAELARHGFGRAQQRVPALLMPMWGVAGEVVGYQARPDNPRSRAGRVVKYETPAGLVMRLDVHPFAAPRLGDPREPLFITEGIKKGDSLVSAGACAVALLGVWNWRGTNTHGGATALADWEAVALKGRRVYIVFDSDVMVNPAVQQALHRLRGFLTSRGAEALLISLRPSQGGEKVGVDDFFASGGSLDELIASATNPSADSARTTMYAAKDGSLIWNKLTRDGFVGTPLANFTARIVRDIIEDDGVEVRRSFEVEAVRGGRSSRFSVAAASFPTLQWVSEHLGASAIVYPGPSVREHLRVAVQTLSGDVQQQRHFSHTGWRQLDMGWAYLHSNGAITATGLRTDVNVTLSGTLARYRLPEIDEQPLDTAIAASLAMAKLGAPVVGAAFLAVTYLAPLAEFLDPARPDFVTWFHGPSGSFKSALAALAEGHFGDFSAQTLPASFQDTANAVERLMFSAKDAVLVVDDYHPATDRAEAQNLARTAARLLRSVGNGVARRRMRADTTMRADLPPRCVAVVTGERLVDGHSNAARLFAVPVSDVAPADLTRAQAQRSLFPLAMAGFVRWLAARADDGTLALANEYERLRTELQSNAHARSPGQLAHLVLALRLVHQFAVERGVISAAEATERLTAMRAALVSAANQHQHDVAEERPARRFIELLASGFASRRCYVCALPGDGPPADAAGWGWEPVSTIDADGEGITTHRPARAAMLLGHVDADWLYLDPESTYAFVATAARAQDAAFPVDAKTLWKRLAEDHLIAVDGEGRRAINARLGGRTRRVLKLRRAALASSPSQDREQREHREHQPSLQSLVPVGCSRNDALSELTGNTERERADSVAPLVPAVPGVPVLQDEEREVYIE